MPTPVFSVLILACTLRTRSLCNSFSKSTHTDSVFPEGVGYRCIAVGICQKRLHTIVAENITVFFCNSCMQLSGGPSIAVTKCFSSIRTSVGISLECKNYKWPLLFDAELAFFRKKIFMDSAVQGQILQ